MQRIRKKLKDHDFMPGSTCCIEFWGAAVGIGAAAGAAIGGGAIAAAGSIAGSAISGSAAKSAAQTQAGAANNATQAELSMFNTTQQNLAPYMTSGANALKTLNSQLPSLTKPFSATQYQASPGYAWQMSQGIDAVQNSASAAGGIGGGNTLKALTTYGQGLANTDYQQALQNYMQQQQQTYNMYSGLVSGGQNAAANLGGISAQVGGQVGGNIIGAGNALAAGQIGVANAASGGINSLAQLANLYGSGSFAGAGSTAGGGVAQTGISGLNTSPSGYGNVGGYYLNCDAGLKKNVEPYRFDGMAGLQVYEFHYKGEENTEPKHFGFIAQEAREKYPNAVKRGPHGYLMLNYAKIPTEEDWAQFDLQDDEVFA
jgi:Chaperone of endosialidase